MPLLAFSLVVIFGCSLTHASGDVTTSNQSISEEAEFEVLYSFDNRDRGEWIGSNHFEGFLISDEWSSHGEFSLMGILKQQDPTHFEPEFTKIYGPSLRDFSGYKAIAVDLRHEEGDCDPGDGLHARIYLTGEDYNMIGYSEAIRVCTETHTATINLPDDLLEGMDKSALEKVRRLSVEFLPCESATGNIALFIDNIRGLPAD